MGIERNHYQISFKVLYDSTRVDTMTSAYHKQMVKKVSTKGNRVANWSYAVAQGCIYLNQEMEKEGI